LANQVVASLFPTDISMGVPSGAKANFAVRQTALPPLRPSSLCQRPCSSNLNDCVNTGGLSSYSLLNMVCLSALSTSRLGPVRRYTVSLQPIHRSLYI
jgi:hypothetical protein